jgi:DNA polymerase elongation subunit (family B)
MLKQMSRFLPFVQARVYVRSLKLKSISEWTKYCKSGRKPTNIPSNPDKKYKDQGWISFGELLKRDFVVPKRQSISKHHEQIRTLNDIVEMDKAGMIISPEIGLHENVAVLDFDNEYANIITGHNISYENLSHDSSAADKQALLPSIVQELVERRVYLKHFLKTQQSESILYPNCEARLDILKQILICL